MSILHHIVWALVNSVWQSALLATLVALSMHFARRSTAAQRYAIWGAVLCACAILPVLDLVLSEGWVIAQDARPALALEIPVKSASAANAQLAGMPRGPVSAAYGHTAFDQGHAAPPGPSTVKHVYEQSAVMMPAPQQQTTAPRSGLQTLAPFIASALAGRYDIALLVAWLVLTNLLIARLVLGYARVCSVKQHLHYRNLSEAEWETFYHMTSRPVAVGYSSAISEPCVIGFRRPVIALPMALSATLSPDDATRVMRHECAHISRWDDYGNLVKQVLSALLFFNPVVSYVSRALDIDREIACDDAVALAEADRILFAKCLYEIASTCTSRRWMPATGLIRGKRHLAIRIRQLLDANHSGSTRVSAFAKLGVLAVVISALPVAFVQIAACQMPPRASLPVAASQQATATHARPNVQASHHVIVSSSTMHPMGHNTPKVFPDPKVKATPEFVLIKVKDDSGLRRVTRLVGPRADQVRLPEAVIQRIRLAEAHAQLATLRQPIAGIEVAQAARVAALAQAVDVRSEVAVVKMAHAQLAASSHDAERDDFLRALHEAGFTNLSVDDLIAIRNAGVSSSFLRQLHAEGLSPMAPGKLVALSNAGVDTAFLAAINKAGYGGFSTDDVIALSNAGVRPAFLESLNALGYRLSAAQAVSLADAGVNQQYVTALVAAGMPKLSVNDLIRLYDNGVTPHYIASLAHVGYSKLSVDDLIRLYNNGVTASFINRLVNNGVSNARSMSVDDLIKLCDAGI